MGHRVALLVLCVGLVWCMDFALRHSLPHFRPPVEQLPIGEMVQAELCLEASDWVGDGQTWRFLADPNRERLSHIIMIKTRNGEETAHMMESDIMGYGSNATQPIGPEYTSKAEAQVAFRKLCQRLGRPKPNIRRTPDQ